MSLQYLYSEKKNTSVDKNTNSLIKLVKNFPSIYQTLCFFPRRGTEHWSMRTSGLRFIEIICDDFNRPLCHLPFVEKLYIHSQNFDSPIYDLPKCTVLTIISPKFNQTLNRLKNLENLYIDSKVYCKKFSNLPRLFYLYLKSDCFNKTIKDMPELRSISLTCYKFNKKIIGTTHLLALAIVSDFFNQKLSEKYAESLSVLIIICPVFHQSISIFKNLKRLIIHTNKVCLGNIKCPSRFGFVPSAKIENLNLDSNRFKKGETIRNESADRKKNYKYIITNYL